MIPSFPKINQLGTKYVADIFDGPVEITEKVDGSQLVWGLVNNELYIRSKGKILDINNPDNMFTEGVEYIIRIQNKLVLDMIYFSEYLKKPHHNTLSYKTIPKNHLMLFGVMGTNETFISDHNLLEKFANDINIDVAPCLFRGELYGDGIMEGIKEFLNIESYLGNQKIEGIVIKNYNKSMWMGDRHIPIMSAKYVSEAFKEVHRSTWSKDNTSMGGFEGLKDSYKSEARWLKAIYSLRDNGLLTLEPKDIGQIIKYINNDIVEEEKESIKDSLWALFHKDILRNSTRGLPEQYKEWLVEGKFNEEK